MCTQANLGSVYRVNKIYTDLDRGRRRLRRRENTTTDIYFRFDVERQIHLFESIFVFFHLACSFRWIFESVVKI